MVYYEGSEELDDLPAEPWYPDEEKSSSPTKQKYLQFKHLKNLSICFYFLTTINSSHWCITELKTFCST